MAGRSSKGVAAVASEAGAQPEITSELTHQSTAGKPSMAVNSHSSKGSKCTVTISAEVDTEPQVNGELTPSSTAGPPVNSEHTNRSTAGRPMPLHENSTRVTLATESDNLGDSQPTSLLFKSEFTYQSTDRSDDDPMYVIKSFRDPDLRRGLPLSCVLSRFGHMFGDSKGSQETYNMSKPVPRLKVFISHNWSTPRGPKFLTLAYHFNWYPALVLSSIAALFVGVLIGLDVFQVQERAAPSAEVGLSIPKPGECSIVAQVVFMVTFFVGHELMKPFGIKGPTVFLDKACINQVDPELQRKGIEGLSAFLSSSDELLIVYTDTYLQKLWTVYELASMLILRPGARIRVLPTSKVFVMWTILACMLMETLVAYLLPSHDYFWSDSSRPPGRWNWGRWLSHAGATSLLFLPLFVRLRSWARRKARITSSAEAFDIRSAKCTVEADRKIVYKNVCALMRGAGCIPNRADDDIALDAFDFMAQLLVPLYLKSSWDRSGMPRLCALCCVPAYFGLCIDILCNTPSVMQQPLVIISSVLYCAMMGTAMIPLLLALSSYLTVHHQHLQGCREATLVLVVWVAMTALLCVSTALFGLLWESASSRWEMVLVQALVFAVMLMATRFVYRPVHFPSEVTLDAKARCSMVAEEKSMERDASLRALRVQSLDSQWPGEQDSVRAELEHALSTKTSTSSQKKTHFDPDFSPEVLECTSDPDDPATSLPLKRPAGVDEDRQTKWTL